MKFTKSHCFASLAEPNNLEHDFTFTTFALRVVTADIIDIRWKDCAHKGVLPQTAVEGINGSGGSIYRLVDTIPAVVQRRSQLGGRL